MIDYIFLVGKTYNVIELTNKEINVLKEYNVKKYTFLYDDFYHIALLDNIFR